MDHVGLSESHKELAGQGAQRARVSKDSGVWDDYPWSVARVSGSTSTALVTRDTIKEASR